MPVEQLRPILLIGLAVVGFLLWQQWQEDYGPGARREPPPAVRDGAPARDVPGAGRTTSGRAPAGAASEAPDLPPAADVPTSSGQPAPAASPRARPRGGGGPHRHPRRSHRPAGRNHPAGIASPLPGLDRGAGPPLRSHGRPGRARVRRGVRPGGGGGARPEPPRRADPGAQRLPARPGDRPARRAPSLGGRERGPRRQGIRVRARQLRDRGALRDRQRILPSLDGTGLRAVPPRAAGRLGRPRHHLHVHRRGAVEPPTSPTRRSTSTTWSPRTSTARFATAGSP